MKTLLPDTQKAYKEQEYSKTTIYRLE